MTRRPTTLRIALTSLCLAAAATPGCIEEDKLSAAIDEVAMQLELLGAPGTAIPGDKLRNDTYSGAISTLKPLVSDGTAEQKAAAWLLIARSELGLAADPVAEAADARRELAAAVSDIRSEVVAYRELAAVAAAAESFDPASEIAELQSKIAERAASAGDVESQMDEVRQQIDGFESQTAEALAASNEHRQTEADLRSEMLSLSAQEALPLATRAAEERSRADELAAQADRFEAQAAVLRPQITAFEGELNRLAEQRKLLEESIESLNAQREATAAEAADYRRRGTEIAARITAAVADTEAYRTGPMQQAYDAAISALETASESAGKATASRSSSNLLSAEIMHSLGGTALAHASALAGFEATIGEAINAAGLSAGSLTTAMQTVTDAADSARARGTEALREARDSYESAGVRGEGADRIEGVVASINAMLGEDQTPADAPNTTTETDTELGDE